MSPLTQGLNYRSACDDHIHVVKVTQKFFTQVKVEVTLRQINSQRVCYASCEGLR